MQDRRLLLSPRGRIFGGMSDEFKSSFSVPLDSDNFLRQECPNCERQFKTLALDPDGSEHDAPEPEGGFYCPYCKKQAASGQWWTKDQVQMATAVAYDEFVAPQLQAFKEDVEKTSQPGGFVQMSVNVERGPEAQRPELTESDDMRLVEFSCHEEPVKVMDNWTDPIHCLLCGETA